MLLSKTPPKDSTKPLQKSPFISSNYFNIKENKKDIIFFIHKFYITKSKERQGIFFRLNLFLNTAMLTVLNS